MLVKELLKNFERRFIKEYLLEIKGKGGLPSYLVDVGGEVPKGYTFSLQIMLKDSDKVGYLPVKCLSNLNRSDSIRYAFKSSPNIARSIWNKGKYKKFPYTKGKVKITLLDEFHLLTTREFCRYLMAHFVNRDDNFMEYIKRTYKEGSFKEPIEKVVKKLMKEE